MGVRHLRWRKSLKGFSQSCIEYECTDAGPQRRQGYHVGLPRKRSLAEHLEEKFKEKETVARRKAKKKRSSQLELN